MFGCNFSIGYGKRDVKKEQYYFCSVKLLQKNNKQVMIT